MTGVNLFAEEVAARCGLDREMAVRAVKCALGAAAAVLAEQGQLSLPGFGTFVVRELPARRIWNPTAGRKEDVPVRKTVRFRPGKRLLAAVREGDPR